MSNRLIKFRTWARLNKQFLYGDLHDFPHGMYDGEITQQFIGLKDKNGKEIYEGDIVKYQWFSSEKDLEDGIGEVFFEDGIFFFDKKMSFCSADCNFPLNQLEVIGNIFENPELSK